jgi:hypothetical protein
LPALPLAVSRLDVVGGAVAVGLVSYKLMMSTSSSHVMFRIFVSRWMMLEHCKADAKREATGRGRGRGST